MNKILKVLGISLLTSSAAFAADAGAGDRAALLIRIGTIVDAYTAANAQHAPAPTYTRIEGTDTKVLLDCFEAGDMTPYFAGLKAEIKAKVSHYIDQLLPHNGNFLEAATAVATGGAMQPTDRTRDAFKVAVSGCLDGLHLATAAPSNGRLSTITRFVADVQNEILHAMDTYIDQLLPHNGIFLATGVTATGTAMQPANHTRDSFKNALAQVIFD